MAHLSCHSPPLVLVSVVRAQQARRGPAGACTAWVSCTQDGLPLSSGLP